jgi:hypothetical protein
MRHSKVEAQFPVNIKAQPNSLQTTRYQRLKRHRPQGFSSSSLCDNEKHSILVNNADIILSVAILLKEATGTASVRHSQPVMVGIKFEFGQLNDKVKSQEIAQRHRKHFFSKWLRFSPQFR